MRQTKEQFLAGIAWNIRDAKEALLNAVAMGNWNGVIKYTKQIQALEAKQWKAERPGDSPAAKRRSHGVYPRSTPPPSWWIHPGSAGGVFGRGKLP